MNELQKGQLVLWSTVAGTYNVVLNIDGDDEVQRRVPAVDDLVLSVLQERTLKDQRGKLPGFRI